MTEREKSTVIEWHRKNLDAPLVEIIRQAGASASPMEVVTIILTARDLEGVSLTPALSGYCAQALNVGVGDDERRSLLCALVQSCRAHLGWTQEDWISPYATRFRG